MRGDNLTQCKSKLICNDGELTCDVSSSLFYIAFAKILIAYDLQIARFCTFLELGTISEFLLCRLHPEQLVSTRLQQPDWFNM